MKLEENSEKNETEQIDDWKRIIIALIKLNKAYREKVSRREGFSQRETFKDSYERR